MTDKQKKAIESGDDSPFVIEAIKEAAEASGMVPEDAKFSDFPAHTQSAILRKAAEMKSDYHKETVSI